MPNNSGGVTGSSGGSARLQFMTWPRTPLELQSWNHLKRAFLKQASKSLFSCISPVALLYQIVARIDLMGNQANILALTASNASSTQALSTTEMCRSCPKVVLILLSRKTANPSADSGEGSVAARSCPSRRMSQNHSGAPMPSSSNASCKLAQVSMLFAILASTRAVNRSKISPMSDLVAATGNKAKASVSSCIGCGGLGFGGTRKAALAPSSTTGCNDCAALGGVEDTAVAGG
mmetsp:Transcript_15255/g.53623  ORF Transcript_15255/g.53623 Transcript_15255/m.53623 type:complete len:234 (-) Transcript_15255:1033-1734(-)